MVGLIMTAMLYILTQKSLEDVQKCHISPFFYFSIIPLFYYIDIWELLQKENFNEGLPISFHGQQNPFKMGVLHEGKYLL